MKYFLCLVLFFGLAAPLLPAHATTLAQTVSGRILLDVESHGEAWYVYPSTGQRSYLEDGDAAYAALQQFGLGISNADIAMIPIGLESRFEMSDADDDTVPDAVEVSLGTNEDAADTDGDGYTDAAEITASFNPLGSGSTSIDTALAERLEGTILLQVETHGEAWYVYPGSGRRYYLGNGEAAYQIMRYLSLGISTNDLAQVPIAYTSPLPSSITSTYNAFALATDEGTFNVKVAMLRRDAYKMVTDTATTADCDDDCAAQPLANYISENNAFAGIHGSYFCPPDYADCDSKTYTFLPPVFNSALETMINDDLLVFHDRPIVAETTDGETRLYHRASDFGDTYADYEATTGLTLSALIGNWPSLVENGENIVSSEPLESAFYNVGTRGGIGWNETYYFIVLASSATVTNLAAVFEALGADNAMNLDGGGSTAMYYDGAYKSGPGRLLPNAIVFVER